MRLSLDLLKTSARFDEANLVSRAGLVPVMALAERAGLFALVRDYVTVTGPCGANAAMKIGCLAAGMAAGADSIDDMDVLRHGAMAELFGGVAWSFSQVPENSANRSSASAVVEVDRVLAMTAPLARHRRS